MGSPKWKIEIGSISFLDRILNTFREAEIENIFVVFRRMNDYPKGNFTRLVNPDPDRGQLSSLKTAVEKIPENTPFLMHLIDRPLVESRTILEMIKVFDNEKIVIPAFENRKGHPVIFPSGMRKIILSAGSGSTIRYCIDSCEKGIQIMDVRDEKIRWNIDTPEALKKYENILNPTTDHQPPSTRANLSE